MAGHSKWANIKHKKALTDAKRGKIWTRLIREITVAARLGGGADMQSNSRLRLAVEKATTANMPKDTIQRAIQRGVGALDAVNYQEVRYEGYGLAGVAVIVDCLTDNLIRTVAEVRHAFTKFGGNLGKEGSVAFLFDHCGQFIFAPETKEELLVEIALEAGAQDIINQEDGSFEVLCAPANFLNLKETLIQAELIPELAEVMMRAQTEVILDAASTLKTRKMLEALENLEDVQVVYTNALIEE